MIRILVFDGPKAGKRFELLWTALHFSTEKSERTPTIIRKEARIQDILEKISVSKNGGDPTILRELKDESTVSLTQEDFDFLQQSTEKVPWTPITSRDVVDLWDWLSAAEKKE